MTLIATAIKLCTKCGTDKLVEDFWKNRNSRDGLQHACKSCHGAQTRATHRKDQESGKSRERLQAWRAANPERHKETQARNQIMRYGLTPDAYHAMLTAQASGCMICDRFLFDETLAPNARRPQIDHDHQTGAVRGLLCFTCNVLLGNAKDSAQTLLAAADYLLRQPHLAAAFLDR